MVEKFSLNPDNYPSSEDHGGKSSGLEESQHRIEMRSHQREVASLRRRIVELWVAFSIVVIAACAGSGWVYTRLNAGNDLLSQLPRVQTMIAGLQSHVNSIEELFVLLKERSADGPMVQEMAARLARAERSMDTGLSAARNQAREIASGIQQSIQELMNRRIGPIETQVNALKAAEEARDMRLAQLESKLDDVRQGLDQELAEVRQNSSREVASAEDRIAGTENAVVAVARQLDRARYDFELNENMSQEIAPGIRLHISTVNRGRQTVNAWMQLPRDGSTVWIDDQPIRQSFVFHATQGGPASELVFTSVNRAGAIGYFLVPQAGPMPATGKNGNLESMRDTSKVSGL
jgi:hypothetical protein